ncbi:uncharacterized protein LOC116196684 [Punica granatum]|uniref:Uncharacterized protein LOC116196684 n=2 Tax=Punica granatum TaxID=22663 RepID=A0A6P8CM34_PUNGR|nr:uncharacterized protein LOC116196684 [Punica granatum]
MTLSNDEITRLHRIRKTVMQMLRDREYLVGDFEINMSRYQFVDKFGEYMKREDLVINKAKRNDSSDQEKEEKLDGDAGLNKLFRDIYQSADEDMRRAMTKSFLESNGTILATNWNSHARVFCLELTFNGGWLLKMKRWHPYCQEFSLNNC